MDLHLQRAGSGTVTVQLRSHSSRRGHAVGSPPPARAGSGAVRVQLRSHRSSGAGVASAARYRRRRDRLTDRRRGVSRAGRRAAGHRGRARSASPGPHRRGALLAGRRPLRLGGDPQRCGRGPRTERPADHPPRRPTLSRRGQPGHPAAPLPVDTGGGAGRSRDRGGRRIPGQGAYRRPAQRHRLGGLPRPAGGAAVGRRRHAADHRLGVHPCVDGAARVRGPQPAAAPLDRRRHPRRRGRCPRRLERHRRRSAHRDHAARAAQAGDARRPGVPARPHRGRVTRALLRPHRGRCRPGRSGGVGLRRVRGLADLDRRCGVDRRPGRHQLADRELPRLPDGHLRAGSRRRGRPSRPRSSAP